MTAEHSVNTGAVLWHSRQLFCCRCHARPVDTDNSRTHAGKVLFRNNLRWNIRFAVRRTFAVYSVIFSARRCRYARAVQQLPEGKDWLYEVKFDGYRCLAGKDSTGVTLWSRRGNHFRALLTAARTLN